MESKKSKKRLFSGMGYREVQRSNSSRRSNLSKKDQKWLKDNSYKNVGWDNVIKLYQKINDFLSSSDLDDPSLEDLFLKADKIGSKYQTKEEIESFNRALRLEVEEISNEIDKQFPDLECELIDYSQRSPSQSNRKSAAKRKK